MKLTVQTPAWLRRIRPPGGAHALFALPLIASPPLAADSISQVLSNTTLWIIGILGGLATLMLTLGGVRYLLANGDPAEVEKAKTAFKSAGIGYALAILAPVIVAVLKSLVGGIIVMTHETLQTSYSAKEIAPRIVIGFVTANLSMVLMTHAVDLANGLSAAFTAGGVNPQSAATSLMNTLSGAIAGNGIFLILLSLAGVILALVLAAVYVIRLMAVVLLAAAAPVCLALYALPQTAWAAAWWWRALTAALAIQVAQGLVMTAAVHVFFSPGWLPGGGALGQTLITLCLLYILMRIPFWIARPVLSPFGRSPLRRAARFVVTAAILSRVGPLLRGTAPASRGTARRRASGTRPGARRAPGTSSSGWSWRASPAPPPAPRSAPGVAGPPRPLPRPGREVPGPRP
jgi:hypothetical protein